MNDVEKIYGEIKLVELTKEKEDEILDNLESNQIFCWNEDTDEPFYIPIESNEYNK